MYITNTTYGRRGVANANVGVESSIPTWGFEGMKKFTFSYYGRREISAQALDCTCDKLWVRFSLMKKFFFTFLRSVNEANDSIRNAFRIRLKSGGTEVSYWKCSALTLGS